MKVKSFERVQFIAKLGRTEDNLTVLGDKLYVVSRNIYKGNLSGAETIGASNGRFVPVEVLNKSKVPIRLDKGQRLSSANLVEVVEPAGSVVIYFY